LKKYSKLSQCNGSSFQSWAQVQILKRLGRNSGLLWHRPSNPNEKSLMDSPSERHRPDVRTEVILVIYGHCVASATRQKLRTASTLPLGDSR